MNVTQASTEHGYRSNLQEFSYSYAWFIYTIWCSAGTLWLTRESQANPCWSDTKISWKLSTQNTLFCINFYRGAYHFPFFSVAWAVVGEGQRGNQNPWTKQDAKRSREKKGDLGDEIQTKESISLCNLTSLPLLPSSESSSISHQAENPSPLELLADLPPPRPMCRCNDFPLLNRPSCKSLLLLLNFVHNQQTKIRKVKLEPAEGSLYSTKCYDGYNFLSGRREPWNQRKSTLWSLFTTSKLRPDIKALFSPISFGLSLNSKKSYQSLENKFDAGDHTIKTEAQTPSTISLACAPPAYKWNPPHHAHLSIPHQALIISNLGRDPKCLWHTLKVRWRSIGLPGLQESDGNKWVLENPQRFPRILQMVPMSISKIGSFFEGESVCGLRTHIFPEDLFG